MLRAAVATISKRKHTEHTDTNIIPTVLQVTLLASATLRFLGTTVTLVTMLVMLLELATMLVTKLLVFLTQTNLTINGLYLLSHGEDPRWQHDWGSGT
jgi:hypothetical protein